MVALSKMREFTCIDLFAGAGGLSCGLIAEGFDIAVAVEIDSVSAKSYILNHSSTKVLVKDIRKITGPELLKQAGLVRGDLDLLTGCPPCQGFSTLRTKRRTLESDDPRNDLIREVLRLVRSMRPRAILIENVPGLAKDRRFVDFRVGLKQAGYCSDYAILNASDFGVPQRRRRLVLIAFRGMNVPANWSCYETSEKNVRQAISHLATSAGSSGDALHDIPEKRTPAMMERIRATPKDGGSRKDLPSEMQCRCHVRGDGYFDVYGRMAWDALAPTITSGCSNPSKGRFLHPEKDRAITLREAAVLQTFPETYKFCLDRGKDHVARQIGNAFPPDLIKPIARIISQKLVS
ncbi:DNA cytosine methyltransferase [Leptothoe sp. PORK10 BA2]|uniref:DNA cytosine methyltransferase n=1 Tax=Leptothoe sp. PORK10 BA2 TaxID=3110254 RepID=UPI002B2154DF|nr:DNA cytosine methyltransferase [Leptothoe sp. PORK10 BA2]MEA5463205.1 DNA cytosine methyltransferase [Leptothoe sp. PORK10 BA2]